MSEASKVKVRRARPSDADKLAELAGELGYPTTAKEIRQRLGRLKPAARHAVFVADIPGSGVVGWIHVSQNHLLESPVRAEVNGLVVSGSARSQGAGKLLLRAAEEWAQKHKCTGVNLRSNVLRERAHRFYEREGYEHYKTQKAFRKPL
jgi:GNAT superfamily N-acetyltransferase